MNKRQNYPYLVVSQFCITRFELICSVTELVVQTIFR